MLANDRLPILGIVGGIGSGKSHVASLFVRHGAHVIDADKLGHEALLDAAIKEQIFRVWGEGIFNDQGEVDRKKLGGIVFAHPDEKVKLESFVFPFIEQGIQEGIKRSIKNPKVKLLILDAAILLETGWQKHCDAVIFVEASEPVRLQRVAKRGWSADELLRREATQWSLEKKKAACQFVIPNEGDEVLTESLVNQIANRYLRQ